MADYFEVVIKLGADAKSVANWITGRLARRMNENNLPAKDNPISAQNLVELIEGFWSERERRAHA